MAIKAPYGPQSGLGRTLFRRLTLRPSFACSEIRFRPSEESHSPFTPPYFNPKPPYFNPKVPYFNPNPAVPQSQSSVLQSQKSGINSFQINHLQTTRICFRYMF